MAGVTTFPSLSSYSLSKLVNTKLQAFVAAENPNVTAIALHPGIVETDMTDASFKKFAKDTPALVGGVGVWLTGEEAKFLTGRYVNVNWDVEELVQRKAEIVKEGMLGLGLFGEFGKEQFA